MQLLDDLDAQRNAAVCKDGGVLYFRGTPSKETRRILAPEQERRAERA